MKDLSDKYVDEISANVQDEDDIRATDPWLDSQDSYTGSLIDEACKELGWIGRLQDDEFL